MSPRALRLLLAILMLALPVCAQDKPLWQEGEILSRKTVPPTHRHPETRYVYRIRAGGLQYVARFDRPLSLAAHDPMKFCVQRRHLTVQDADGSERKASLLKKNAGRLRR